MTNPIAVTGGLTRRFGNTLAVDHLTLEVYASEVFGILGHNGAGKTTTVRLLNGVFAPSDGTARVLGLSPVRDQILDILSRKTRERSVL
jgi:ABC-2 type transport system ATP-binding protein